MGISEQSRLIDRLNIDSREIAERKRLFGISEDDVGLLVGCSDLVAAEAKSITDSFFADMADNEDVAGILADSRTVKRLRVAFRRYILQLFQGNFDTTYVESRLEIGAMHERLGITPKVYITGVRKLKALIDDALEAKDDGTDPERHQQRKEALHKILLFDTQFVFDTYIDCLMREVKSAREELQHYASELEQKVAERTQQLYELSRTDALTELFNRRGFEEHLAREMAVAQRYSMPLCLVYLDLNGFKKLNDEEGHDAGDAILELVGNVLRHTLRQGDLPCRFGGDEFCIIMPRTDLEGAKLVCQRVVEEFDQQHDTHITFSLGLVQTGPEHFISAEELIRQADGQMYEAKAESRRRRGYHVRTRIIIDNDEAGA